VTILKPPRRCGPKNLGSLGTFHAGHDAFVEEIDQIRSLGADAAALTPYLKVNHPAYARQPGFQVKRKRAYALAAFRDVGLPLANVPIVLEVLRTSLHASLTAAAAIALRSSRQVDATYGLPLMQALYNVWDNDRPICFTSYNVAWPNPDATTAMQEILKTISWLGSEGISLLPFLKTIQTYRRALFSRDIREALDECIASLAVAENGTSGLSSFASKSDVLVPARASFIHGWEDTTVEDQDGSVGSWASFFGNSPSLFAFFYTSCRHPQKCVRTIHMLSDVYQKCVANGIAESVRIAAVTYNPERDNATALRSYGQSRSLALDSNFKLLRVPRGFAELKKNLDLQVSYVGNIVSDHGRDIYISKPFRQSVSAIEPQSVTPEYLYCRLADLL